jgi:hypothetical protein
LRSPVSQQRQARPALRSDSTTSTSEIPCLNYAAGLCVRDIAYGLLWEPMPTNRAGRILGSLPSWTWASVATPICWRVQERSLTSALRLRHITAQSLTYGELVLDGSISAPFGRDIELGQYPHSVLSVNTSSVTLTMSTKVVAITLMGSLATMIARSWALRRVSVRQNQKTGSKVLRPFNNLIFWSDTVFSSGRFPSITMSPALSLVAARFTN